MTWFSALTAAHVILTTSGYAGLIASNAWLLALSRGGDPSDVRAGVTAWRKLLRWFGPLLGLGILAGFALAILMDMSLVAAWLVATYALVIVTMLTQGAITVPWQRRAEAAIASGAGLSTRPLAVVLAIFSLVYVAILWLMLMRPHVVLAAQWQETSIPRPIGELCAAFSAVPFSRSWLLAGWPAPTAHRFVISSIRLPTSRGRTAP